MGKVYVNSKQECPRDAVLRQGPRGRLYYRPEERGMGAEVGGVMDSFDDLFSTFYKRRVYVENPAAVPSQYEPQRGGQGGWYYDVPDRPSEEEEQNSQVLEQLVDMIVEQIIPELHEDDYYQEDVAPRVYETVRDRVQMSDGSVTEESFRSLVKDTVKDTMPEQKNELDRVYVGDESQVPEEYEVQEDENGDMYYVRTDDQFIDSGRETTSYDFDKQEEVTEGLTWNEHVMVVDVDREEGMATLVDTEGSSEWEEPLESVEAKLEQLEANEDHEWMYELVAGEYPSLEADDVMEMVHDAAGIDKGVRPNWEERLDKDKDPCWEGYTMVGLKDNGNPRCVPDDDVENYDEDKSQKSRIYVDNPDDVPDQYSPQTSDNGAIYYETDSGSVDVGSDDDFGVDPRNLEDKPEEELEELRDYLMEQHGAARDARDARGGRGTDTPEDEMMRDILEVVREIDDELWERDNNKSQKSRVYVDNESEVPEQYDAQTSDSGAVYYETDSGGGERETVGDEVSDEELDQMEDNVEEMVEEIGPEIREVGEDEAYDIASEDPYADVDEINDRVNERMIDEAMDRIQDEFGVELEGDAYDAVNEAITEEMGDWMGDAELTEQEVNEIRSGDF